MIPQFVSLIGIFVGIIIVIFNYFNKKYSPSSYLLAGYFFVLSIYGLAHFTMSASTSPLLFVIQFNHIIPTFVSIGPILYFYTRITLDDRFHILDKRNLIHLVLVIISFIDIMPYLILPFDHKIQIAKNIISLKTNISNTHHLLFTDITASLMRQLINFIYLICSLKFIIYKKIDRPINLTQLKIINTWLRVLISSNLIFNTLILLYLIETAFVKTNYLTKYSAIILNSSWVAYSGIILSIFLFPNILYGLPQNTDIINIATKAVFKKGYKPFELDNAYILKIDHFITQYIESHPYIHEKYSLSVLTADSKIPTHHLNFYFKEHLNTNFNSWKNNLKISYAVELIKQGILDQLTIEAVALQSGFKSYSNFYAVFKNKTGLTPSEYIGKNKNDFNLTANRRNDG